MEFITQNLSTIVICLILASLAFLAVTKLRRDKKKGNACSGCPHSGNCPSSCKKKD